VRPIEERFAEGRCRGRCAVTDGADGLVPDVPVPIGGHEPHPIPQRLRVIAPERAGSSVQPVAPVAFASEPATRRRETKHALDRVRLSSHPIRDRGRSRGAVIDCLGDPQLAHHVEHLDLGQKEGAFAATPCGGIIASARRRSRDRSAKARLTTGVGGIPGARCSSVGMRSLSCITHPDAPLDARTARSEQRPGAPKLPVRGAPERVHRTSRSEEQTRAPNGT
jgi:hypothetical protein